MSETDLTQGNSKEFDLTQDLDAESVVAENWPVLPLDKTGEDDSEGHAANSGLPKDSDTGNVNIQNPVNLDNTDQPDADM